MLYQLWSISLEVSMKRKTMRRMEPLVSLDRNWLNLIKYSFSRTWLSFLRKESILTMNPCKKRLWIFFQSSLILFRASSLNSTTTSCQWWCKFSTTWPWPIWAKCLWELKQLKLWVTWFLPSLKREKHSSKVLLKLQPSLFNCKALGSLAMILKQMQSRRHFLKLLSSWRKTSTVSCLNLWTLLSMMPIWT